MGSLIFIVMLFLLALGLAGLMFAQMISPIVAGIGFAVLFVAAILFMMGDI